METDNSSANSFQRTLRLRGYTVLWIILIVVIASLAAFVIAEKVSDTDLKKTLHEAAITLIFGSLLGGVAKILLDDFERGRQQRADEAQFLSNILTDLKSVYDRVEQARILLPAHQSAKTYGEEMRDIIVSRVKLLNVIRALDKDVFKTEKEKKLRKSIDEMANYLKDLLAIYQSKYKSISDLQSEYESKVKLWLENMKGKESDKTASHPENEPWDKLREIKEVADFIEVKEKKTDYNLRFVNNLDDATEVLRGQLRKIIS
jgi:hypothetical protein